MYAMMVFLQQMGQMNKDQRKMDVNIQQMEDGLNKGQQLSIDKLQEELSQLYGDKQKMMKNWKKNYWETRSGVNLVDE